MLCAQVFLRVGHATTGADADPAPESKSETSKVSPESKFDNSEGASSKVVTEGLMARHFRAMMKKRVTYFCRDCQSWCCQLILPLVMLIFGVIYYKVGVWWAAGVGGLEGFPLCQISTHTHTHTHTLSLSLAMPTFPIKLALEKILLIHIPNAA